MLISSQKFIFYFHSESVFPYNWKHLAGDINLLLRNCEGGIAYLGDSNNPYGVIGIGGDDIDL